MIARAAEANSSCFRTAEEGGLLPWRELVTEYIKIALDTENKYGNTKFLLSQLMPGKSDLYRPVTSSKNYSQVCEILGLHDFADLAMNVDQRLGITELQREKMAEEVAAVKKAKAKNKSAQAAGGNMGRERAINTAGKSSLSERGVGAAPPMTV
jgi:tRNA-dihydrouridine synthase 2